CDVPLVACERSLGTLSVGSLQSDAFTEESIALIEGVARQVAMAVSNALAFEEIALLKHKLAEERLFPLGDLEPRRSWTGHDDGGTTLKGMERTHILRVLEETNWILAGPRGAAARLGMKRTTLQSLMGRLGI